MLACYKTLSNGTSASSVYLCALVQLCLSTCESSVHANVVLPSNLSVIKLTTVIPCVAYSLHSSVNLVIYLTTWPLGPHHQDDVASINIFHMSPRNRNNPRGPIQKSAGISPPALSSNPPPWAMEKPRSLILSAEQVRDLSFWHHNHGLVMSCVCYGGELHEVVAWEYAGVIRDYGRGLMEPGSVGEEEERDWFWWVR